MPPLNRVVGPKGIVFDTFINVSKVYFDGPTSKPLLAGLPGSVSKLHEGTKLHEDTFARRQICTSGQNCAKTCLHGCEICTGGQICTKTLLHEDKFARADEIARIHICTAVKFARGVKFARRQICTELRVSY